MTTTDERPNWVDERARCTLEAKFEEIIGAVRFDVEQINSQPPARRHRQRFIVEKEKEMSVQVRRYPECNPRDTSGYVTFERETKQLVVHLPGHLSFNVVPKWNEAELRCDLLVDGEVLELWRISQKALGVFFFEED